MFFLHFLMFFSCFYVLLTVCVVVFYQWHFIHLFSCIAASLFNKLTCLGYLQRCKVYGLDFVDYSREGVSSRYPPSFIMIFITNSTLSVVSNVSKTTIHSHGSCTADQDLSILEWSAGRRSVDFHTRNKRILHWTILQKFCHYIGRFAK